MNDILYRDAPDIKIYTDDSSYQKTDAQSHDNDDTLSNKVKLVYYPGLYDSTSNEQQQQQQQPTYHESHVPYADYSYQSQSYTTQPTYYHYYDAQQYYHPPPPPPPASQYYYPGTIPTTMPYNHVDMGQHDTSKTSAPVPPSSSSAAAAPESDDDMDISDGE